MTQEEDLANLYKLLEMIANIRVGGFLPKNINIVSIPAKIVITPHDKYMAWGEEAREIHVELAEQEKKIRIFGLKPTDTSAKLFAERIEQNIKKDEYLNTKYSVKVSIPTILK